MEEETRRYRPTKNYLEPVLPPLNIAAFETPLMKTELERVGSRMPMEKSLTVEKSSRLKKMESNGGINKELPAPLDSVTPYLFHHWIPFSFVTQLFQVRSSLKEFQMLQII